MLAQAALPAPGRSSDEDGCTPSPAPANVTPLGPQAARPSLELLLPLVDSKPPLLAAPAACRRAPPPCPSLTLIGKAPLRIQRKAEIVASTQKWHLAITHVEPDNRAQPKLYVFDRRRCLDLVLAVKRAWWRIAFHEAMRKSVPGTRIEGIYTASEFLELKRDLFGDHIALFGVKLRRRRHVRAFRRSMIAVMRLGRRFSHELVRNGNRLS